jgi:hypothetical protein
MKLLTGVYIHFSIGTLSIPLNRSPGHFLPEMDQTSLKVLHYDII